MHFVVSFVPVVVLVVLWFVFVYCVLCVFDRIKSRANRIDEETVSCFDRLTGYGQEEESKITWSLVK